MATLLLILLFAIVALAVWLGILTFNHAKLHTLVTEVESTANSAYTKAKSALNRTP